MDLISALWLPIFILLFAIATGSLCWFVFVRSIEIPWDDRTKEKHRKEEEDRLEKNE